MTDREKPWQFSSPGFDSTREAYEYLATTDHEKLIEEAAKAIWDADTTIPETWDNKSVVEWDRNTYRGMARAALAVFEKALTPTDDEREVLTVTDDDLDRLEGIAGPIYRSTVEASSVSKYLVSDLGHWIVRLVAEVRRLRTAEAEDERIDAWHMVADHEAFKACYDEEQPLIDSVLARITELHELETTVNELAPAPNLPLEPSDAQVQAYLLEEWKHEDWAYDGTDDLPYCACGVVLAINGVEPVHTALDRHRVRAALRAAGVGGAQ